MPKNQVIMSIGLWIVIFVAFYFILIRPQKKKDQKLREMRDSIEKGDTVVTIGGIIAKVTRVEEDKIILELGPNRTKVPFEKWAIGRVVEKVSKDEVVEVEEKIEE
ncbi:preprotein translocase subunit YajC [Peptostreptococcus porci]|uniref:Preprotein translocase subunit YajC n=1 Tax=Peptostreptococcus porci TaxID=2652282 RepID=A0A6N7XEZ7_9FIRM|nr:preprotein translocase subunit YajC [Peptostreptococcus porci]MDD7183476.1 preprotein translocase subunit YajC [Peptostreptococcus porci]MDY2795170.1 preprotein translocase subunit YajC [Peptostreptococcus porci]MDY4127431.1 preprotein translocase subunit YajC [Peptostreptococcus porci]MDY4560324.1 preprotein translocase subunit YajC [Peptostreptococcus porci]MDY5436792.1 preprotein translocase subunit YajC [Peptostreptococcus porci]